MPAQEAPEPVRARVERDNDIALLPILIKTLRRLGEVGHPDDASRLAAKAWSALRHTDPQAAERINGTMHYLARLPELPDRFGATR